MADRPSTNLCRQHLGAQGELIASAWLLDLGYEVFRNVSPSGPADIVAWHPSLGETHLIDVKTQRFQQLNSRGTRAAFGVPKGPAGVHILLVDGGHVAGFFRRPEHGMPVRYWPLGIVQPALPEGYDDTERPSPTAPQFIEWNGRKWTVAELAKEAKLSIEAFRVRLKMLPVDLAVTLPRGSRRLRTEKIAEMTNGSEPCQ